MQTNLIILPEDDAQTLQCAANLVARFTNRMLNPPRLPTRNEFNVLNKLQRDLKTPFSPNTIEFENGEYLLKRLWVAFYSKDIPYSRYSKKWSKMGFQHNKDPTSDFRGGGLLSLQCLVYMFEKQPAISRHMYDLQSVRISKRGPYANYPFACAGITLCKKLCEILLICEPMTGKATQSYEHSQLTFWQVVGSRNSFYELFVWSFMLLDQLWDEMGATYMDFQTVIKIVIQRVSNVLLRLPNNVVPSARSFHIDEDYESSDIINDNRCIYENTMCIEESDDEVEVLQQKNQTLLRQEPSNVFSLSYEETSNNCQTADLLGLDTYTNQPTNQLAKENDYSTLPSASFFEEFGLDR